MKLSEVIKAAQDVYAAYGDMAVCVVDEYNMAWDVIDVFEEKIHGVYGSEGYICRIETELPP